MRKRTVVANILQLLGILVGSAGVALLHYEPFWAGLVTFGVGLVVFGTALERTWPGEVT